MGTDLGQKPSDQRPASSLYDVFISYAAADRAWVDGYLIDGLERAGVRCHREAAFALGVPRLAEFENAVRSSARILLVLSPAYFATDTASFVDLLAQTYGLETSTWPVIPLRLEPVKLPTRLAMLTALDATDPDERERVLEKLSNLFQRPIPAAPARPPCPYPGMRPFTMDDGFPFFGRDHECEELLQHLRQSRFLTVIGGSGSGKSSLVFAGLVPRLRKTNLFGPGKWLVRSIRPGERPLAELAQALGADPGNPAAAVAHVLEADPEAKQLLLVVDQFEEVFAPDQGKSEQAADWSLSALGGEDTRHRRKSEPFCRALQGLLNVESVAVVLTVRADFYAELMGTPLWPQIKANRVDVGPLAEAGLREAIYRPAETVGVYVESALVERLASDAVEARSLGILPLVQEVLVQLWEKLERRVLPLHAYAEFVLPRMAYDQHYEGQERTGLEVAIARHADGVLKRLEVANPGQVEIARRILVRLVQFGEGRPDTRRQQSVAQLRAGNDPVHFEATLKDLASNRLITLTGDRQTGRRRADIAHEALIRGWPQLQRWIEESRKAEEVRRKLERKAQEWIDAGSGREGLLGTGGLVEAESFLASPDGSSLTDDDPIRRLIRESSAEIHRAEIERETARQRELDHARQRVKILLRSAVFLGLLLAGLVGVTLFAFHARTQAQINQAEAEKQAKIAAVNQTKAEAKEAEAQQSQARARDQANKARIASVKADEAAARATLAAALAEKESRNAREKARIASALRSEALSVSESNVRLDRSLLFAIEGFQTNDSIEARNTLYRALVARPEVETFLNPDPDEEMAFIAVNPEGTLLASVTRTDKKRGVVGRNGYELADGLIFWDLPSGTRRREVPRFERVLINQVAFSPTGDLLAVVFTEQRGDRVIDLVRIWDVARRDWLGEPLAGDEGLSPLSACFAPKGDDILAVGYQIKGEPPTGCVILWDSQHRRKLGEPLHVAEGAVSVVTFRPDGKTLAAGYNSTDNRRPGGVVMWDLGRRQRTNEGFGTEEAGLVRLAFRPDGLALAAGCSINPTREFVIDPPRGTVRVRDLARGVPVGNPVDVSPGGIAGLAFSEPSGEWLFGGYRGVGESCGGLYRLSLDGSSKGHLRWPVFEGHVTDSAPLPGDTRFVVAFGSFGATFGGGGVCILNLQRRSRLEMAPPPFSTRHTSTKRGHETTYCGADGKILAISSMVGEHEGVVELVDPATDRRIGDPLPTPGFVSDMSTDREGKRLAAAIGSGDTGSVILWDLARGQRLGTPLTIPEGPARMVAFGGTDPTILAAGYSGKRNSGGVVLWDLARRERLGPPLPVAEGWVSSVAISPDGATLAAASGTGDRGGNLILWDLGSHERRTGLRRTPGDATDLAFSPDGKLLAVAVDLTEGTLSAGTVLLYDVRSGRQKGKPLNAAEGGLKYVRFAPDGKTLATAYRGGSDGAPSGLILWDVATRERFGPPLQLADGQPDSVEYRADGKVLAISHSRRVSFFDMDVNSWIDKAQRIANRNFTRDEWDRYYPGEPYRRTIRSLPWPKDLPEDERERAEAWEKEQFERREAP